MKKIKLGELLHIRRGTSLSGKYYASTGDKIRLTLGNFNYPRGGFKPNTSKTNLYFVGDIKPEFVLNEGDIITPLTEQVPGLLGETARIPESNKYIQSGDIGLVIIDDQSRLSNAFAYYLLSSDIIKNQLMVSAQQTKIRHTTPEKIIDCYALLPEYKLQIAISSLLDNLNQKITINRKINDNLMQMASMAFMHYFFTRTPNGTLGNIIIEHPKSNIQVGEAQNSNGNVPFFTSGDSILKWDTVLVDDRCCYLNTGGNADVKFYVGKAAYSTDAWCISGKDDLSDYLYLLLHAIKLELNKKYFQGTGLKHLQKPLLKDRPIYIPTTQELNAFNAQIKPMLTKISDNIRENQRLMSIRDWLLPLLMNGQATVEA